jgi:anti-sigma factor RsiW
VTHSEIRAHLSEYLERDLDPDRRSRIAAHLESCTSCQSELQELRSTISLLRRLPEPGHPRGLADAVLARVAQDARGPARVHRLVLRLSEPRFAAALAAGIAGLLLLVQGGPPDRSESAAGPVGTIASVPESGPRDVRAGVVSGATPSGALTIYASHATPRARLNELARQLRGAGHPSSPSMAAHLEAQPTIALADWQP